MLRWTCIALWRCASCATKCLTCCPACTCKAFGLESEACFAHVHCITRVFALQSFSVGAAADTMVLPTNVLERWFQRFDDKFKRDPDFLVH